MRNRRVNGSCNKQTNMSEGKQHRGKLNKPYLTSGHQHNNALHFSALRERTRVCSLSGELKQGLKGQIPSVSSFHVCLENRIVAWISRYCFVLLISKRKGLLSSLTSMLFIKTKCRNCVNIKRKRKKINVLQGLKPMYRRLTWNVDHK